MNLNNTKLVTHAHCMDGSTCAIVFLAAGGRKENIEFSSPSHDKVDDIVSNLWEYWEGDILLADISISLELAEKINKFHNNRITLLDHHASAIPLSKFSWCHIDELNSRSGGALLYDWLSKEGFNLKRYKDLVDCVDDVDRWQWILPESNNIYSLHKILGQEFFIERFLKKADINPNSNEKYSIDLSEKKKESFIKQKKKELQIHDIKINNHSLRVAFVDAGSYQSELGNDIVSDTILDVDIAIMVSGKSVSMRTSKDSPVSVGNIASLNKGGGHFAAAGFSVRNVLGMELTEFIRKNMRFE